LIASSTFDALYGPFFDRLLAPNAKAIVTKSIARYLRWITDDDAALT
jgi:hypothetical protein